MSEPAAPAPPPRATPKRRRSRARAVLKWTGIALAGLAVLVTAALLWPGTRQWAFEEGRTILADAGVRSSSIDGGWTEMTLHDVEIADDEGVWATAREVALSWSPLGLLGGAADLNRVEVRGARILRQPVYAADPAAPDEPFAWPDLPVDVTLASLTGDLSVDAAAFGEALSATFTATAALTSGDGKAELTVVRTDGVAGEASVAVETTADLGAFSLAIHARDSHVAALLAGDARLAGLEVAVDASRDGPSCTGAAAIAAEAGPLAAVAIEPDCTFKVALADVARLLPADAGLVGPANLSLQLLEDGNDKTTEVRLAADLSSLSAADPALARLLPGASASGRLAFTADGVRLNELAARLAGGTLTLTGAAEQAGDRVRAAADIAATDLSALRPDLKGALTARATFDSAAATPIVVDASGTNVAARDLLWPTLALDGALDAKGTGQVSVKGDGATPIDLAISLTEAFGDAAAVDAKGVVVSATVAAKASPVAGGYDIAASIETERLDRLGALAGVDAAGRLKAALTARTGAGANLTLDATLSGGRYDGTPIGDASLSAKGPLDALALKASGKAPAAGRTLAYAIDATLSGLSEARVTALKLTAGDAGLTAAAPFRIAFASGLGVDGLDVRLTRNGKAAGRIAASATKDPAGLKTALTLTKLDLAALTAILARPPVKGLLDAEATLDGGAGRATLDGRIAGLEAAGNAAPPADVTLKGAWSNGRVSLSAVASARGLPDARAEIAFPMARAADGGLPSPAPAATLSGSVRWAGRVASVWRLLDIDGHDLDGDADIRLAIGGTLSDPRLTGTAGLQNGRYANDDFGTRLQNLDLDATLKGDEVRLTGSATDGARGRLAIDLTAPLGNAIGRASGGVTLTAMRLLARDDLSARIDGALKLAPGASGPVLGGTLTVTDLVAGIPEGGPPDLVVVDVIDPDAPPAPPPRAESGNDAPVPAIALAVDVAIPGPAKVGGRGLDSLWKGALKIGGDLADPRIAGKLTLQRGTLAFGSRSFALTEGVIEFDGGPSLEPRLRIVATQEEADLTASLILSGRASAPEISVSSTPARPQDEVFALLLFGRSVSRLSAIEGLELANSIAALSGGGDIRGGVLGELRQQFGLDVLSVDLGEDGQATVKAGSYLADRVYFELRQGGPNGGTTGHLEIEIDENISAETDVGPDASSSVGARYKLDY